MTQFPQIHVNIVHTSLKIHIFLQAHTVLLITNILMRSQFYSVFLHPYYSNTYNKYDCPSNKYAPTPLISMIS